eukprot:228110_1
MIFCYPLVILSCCTFSMYPLFSYATHKSMEIGKGEVFYRKLYEYCCDSRDKLEFQQKLIILNYVSIMSYFTKIKRSDDEEYYMFAEWLSCQFPLDVLKNISFEEFQ